MRFLRERIDLVLMRKHQGHPALIEHQLSSIGEPRLEVGVTYLILIFG